MCELPAEPLSDIEEEEAPSIFNALLCAITHFQLGGRLEAFLTEEQLGTCGTLLPLCRGLSV